MQAICKNIIASYKAVKAVRLPYLFAFHGFILCYLLYFFYYVEILT